MSRLATLIATFGGVGRLPEAPGTWGSLAALPAAYALHWLGGGWLLAAATLALFAAGVWAAGVHIAVHGGDDPAEVVVDEVVGQWIALWPLSLGLTLAGAEPSVFPWPGWVAGFLLFRFFDIVKPPPVNWLDRIPGRWGVMLDDAAAGAIAALIVLAAAAISHGWLA